MLGAVEVTVGALKKALAQPTMVKEGFLEKAAHKLDLEDKGRQNTGKGVPPSWNSIRKRAGAEKSLGNMSLWLDCGVWER